MKGGKFDEDAFRDLDREYRANAGGDLLVRALNTMPADDRALMLAYIVCGNNSAELARMAGVSQPAIANRIWRIQVIVKDRYERLKRKQEENDESIF